MYVTLHEMTWWQVNIHEPYVCGFTRSDIVHGCMVYTECAEMAAVSCGTSHASAVSIYTTEMDIQNAL